MSEDPLASLRAQIDAIDARLVETVAQRLEVAEQIGQAKRGADIDVADLAREEQIVRAAVSRAAGAVPEATVVRVLREVIGACLARQRPLKVAYLGPEGTFSHEAALQRFGSAAQLQACATIAESLRLAEKGEADFALVPFENSTEGGVGATMDELSDTALSASGETFIRIRQCLLAQPQAQFAQLKRLYSHPQSFGQCRRWLDANLAGCGRVACDSNAAAAERAAADGAEAAAVGPAGAAAGRELAVLEDGIEDNPRNVTRFFVMGRKSGQPSGDDKTSVMFAVRHKPGALLAMLEIIADAGINMTKLESRPMPGGDVAQYLFFTDMAGHSSRPPLAAVIGKLRAEAAVFKLIGSYPRAADADST